ncbi:hypothetical protein V1291_005320 [Nitrobacteraceae bacterium AZCC 1564]
MATFYFAVPLALIFREDAMRLPAISMFFLLLVSANAVAEDGIMRGYGLSQCSELISKHKKDKRFTEIIYGTWMVGFISGINMQLFSDERPRHLIPEPAKVFEGVRQRCESKPDAYVFAVLVDYVATLPPGTKK